MSSYLKPPYGIACRIQIGAHTVQPNCSAALGMKLNSSLFSSMSTSMSFSWHDSYSSVSADSFRNPKRPRAHLGTSVLSSQPVQRHLQSFGLQTPPFHPKGLGQTHTHKHTKHTPRPPTTPRSQRHTTHNTTQHNTQHHMEREDQRQDEGEETR